MAYGDPKLPRSVLRGEQLFVGDDKEPYFRDPEAWICLYVTDFSVPGGFERQGESLFDRGTKTLPRPVYESLRGKGVLRDKTRFGVAGWNFGGEGLPIDFTLRPALETDTGISGAAPSVTRTFRNTDERRRS